MAIITPFARFLCPRRESTAYTLRGHCGKHAFLFEGEKGAREGIVDNRSRDARPSLIRPRIRAGRLPIFAI